jgi:vesicle coat complex subunit
MNINLDVDNIIKDAEKAIEENRIKIAKRMIIESLEEIDYHNKKVEEARNDLEEICKELRKGTHPELIEREIEDKRRRNQGRL